MQTSLTVAEKIVELDAADTLLEKWSKEKEIVNCCIVFYLTQSHCFRAILRVQVVIGEGSFGQF